MPEFVESASADKIYEAFKEADVSVVQETVRLAELYIQQQLATLTAQAQRAATLAGIFGTTAVFLGTVALSEKLLVWLPDHSQFIGIGGAFGMLVAAFACALAANSTDIRYAGNEPVNWLNNRRLRDRLVALAGELGNYQSTIEYNRGITKTNGSLLRIGMIIGLCVPLIIVVALLVFSWPSPPSEETRHYFQHDFGVP